MQINYKILFAVNILNDYYRDGRCKDFVFVPSAETAIVLRKYHILYKTIANKLVLLARVNDADEPLDDIDSATKFVFYMALQNPVFVNFSNVNMDALQTKRFYFTNLNKNDGDDKLNLTSPIADYDNTEPYETGELVDDGAGNVFECIAATTGNDTTTGFWAAKGKNQYASVADMKQHTTKTVSYTAPLPATDTFIINTFAFNKQTNTYNSIVKTETQKFSEPTRDVRIDLSTLKPGGLHINVNNNSLDTYTDDDFVFGGYFGVIEIFSHLPDTDDFAFIENGKLVDRTYTIHFANRLAFWKYIIPKEGILSIKDKNNIYDFLPVLGPAPAFTSVTPIPINEAAKSFVIELQKQVNSDKPLAPGPDLQTSGVITKTGNDFSCNIYLNY